MTDSNNLIFVSLNFDIVNYFSYSLIIFNFSKKNCCQFVWLVNQARLAHCVCSSMYVINNASQWLLESSRIMTDIDVKTQRQWSDSPEEDESTTKLHATNKQHQCHE